MKTQDHQDLFYIFYFDKLIMYPTEPLILQYSAVKSEWCIHGNQEVSLCMQISHDGLFWSLIV